MDVNMSNVLSTSENYSSYSTKKNVSTTTDKTVADEVGAVYEKSANTGKATYSVAKMSEEDRASLVKQLKDEQSKQQQQLLNIAQDMMTKQAGAYTDVWKFLASGDYTVTEAAKKQAEEAISEDGYYGVKQTSERLFDFAMALAGDDVEKMQKMQDAVVKGFKEATKAWGKDLPEICGKTLDATNKLFEDYYASKKVQ